MPTDCLFCKVVSGALPSHKIFESKHSLAFLDIYPPTEGMTLVVPKKHAEDWWAMDEQSLGALMGDAKYVARLLKKKFPEKRVGVQIEGLDVPHVHVKLFPFSTAIEFRALPDRDKKPDHENLRMLAERLRGGVEKN